METSAVGIPIVFIAGLASFLSPCVLPLVPGYLAYTGATSVDMIRSGGARPTSLVVPAAVFVAGFTVVFVALGMAASAIGGFLIQNQDVLTRVSGVLIIFMGLAFLGVIPLPWLYYTKKLEAKPAQTIPGAFLLGFGFGFGWTPCIGPALGVALGVAAVEQTPGRGALLLLIYSLGLGIPFILAALGVSKLMGALEWVRRRQILIMRSSGVLLIAVGLLFVFNKVFLVSAFIQKAMEASGLDFWNSL
ncbi:MAG: cytochrome c biogenesis protein CcdA [Actinobacteria bacterium]|nr:cytochrome c biogenesis protein CcdA [Actinomycetota bacterium]